MSEEEKKVKKPKSKARKIIEWVLTGLFLVVFAVLGIAQIDGMVHKKDHFNQTLKFGYGTFVVQTESMEPVYKKGYALVTKYGDFDNIYKDYNAGKKVDLTFYYDYNAFNEASASEYSQPKSNPQLTKRIEPADFPIITHRVMEMHVIDANKKAGEGKYMFIAAGINDSVASATDSQGRVFQYQAFSDKYVLGRVVIGSAVLGGMFSFVSSIWGLLILLLIPAFYLIITSVIDIFKAYKEPEEASEGASSNGEGTTKSGTLELSEEDKKRLKEELLEEMLNKKKGDSK